MGNYWKEEHGTLFAFINGQWSRIKAAEIYRSAFGGDTSLDNVLPPDFESIRDAFPQIKFSKFSVKPEISVSMENEKIQIHCFFEKKRNIYNISIPLDEDTDYSFADTTWCYFSGEYFQILEIFKVIGIFEENISFEQYVKLLNACCKQPNITLIDHVKPYLTQTHKLSSLPQPTGLNATLYPYQKIGYQWLKFITDAGCGCVLGDEMGLGKTLQVIALMVDRQKTKLSPALVVAPVSLLENWKREISRFAPNLSVYIHHGANRTGNYRDLLSYDVIVTSYGTTITDLSMFEMTNWDLLILDEAQNIKNPAASRTVSIKQIPHRAGIAVSGTPFENHITDIWSILDFAVPACLGKVKDFEKEYADDLYGAEKIEPLLTALMIRRKVNEVAQDLPEKVIIPQPLRMDDNEAIRYEAVRQDIISSMNPRSATLASLTKLRMYCTHPLLLESEKIRTDPQLNSTKYIRFCEIVEEIVNSREKVIVFTSYTDMFGIIVNDISTRYGIPVDIINGQTPSGQRQEIVDKFSSRIGSAMLVLNPRAAGVGLNITAANHVIHYNLEWNPALEDQATARAFRRGQSKTVFVYRLFFVNTVEEVVNEKIEHKRTMAEAAVVGSEGTEENHEMILRALGLTPVKGEI